MTLIVSFYFILLTTLSCCCYYYYYYHYYYCYNDMQHVDLMGTLTDGSVPRRFDTDVNAPALAEYIYREDMSHSSVAYITVGTGVGVGLVVNGKTVHGQ